VKEIDWGLVEIHHDLPKYPDELRLKAAWVREIIDIKRPRRKSRITHWWFGEDDLATTTIAY